MDSSKCPGYISALTFEGSVEMAVLNAAFPILPVKFDDWQTWHNQFIADGPQRDGWEDQMRRYGITRQLVSIQRTPHGDFVIVLFEGDDPGAVFAGLASSDNEFDRAFAAKIKEVHGVDVSEPPPPISELVLEYDA